VAKRAGRSLGLVILGIGAVARAASPLPDGVYKVGALGEVRVIVDGFGHVRGTFVSGSSCAFDPNQEILSGDLVGSALVGKVTVCLEGPPSCGTTLDLPFFAVPSDGLYTAFVTLPDQCSTPALDGQLTLNPTHKTRLQAAAKLMDSREWDPARHPDAVIAWLRRAASTRDPTLSPAHEFEILDRLGSVLNTRRNFAEARDVLLRAVPLMANLPADARWPVLYNLGCAEAQLSQQDPGLARSAFAHLKEAILLAAPNSLTKHLQEDAELAPLRVMPEFRKLLELSRKGGR
jgi:hypothetical protein